MLMSREIIRINANFVTLYSVSGGGGVSIPTNAFHQSTNSSFLTEQLHISQSTENWKSRASLKMKTFCYKMLCVRKEVIFKIPPLHEHKTRESPMHVAGELW